LPFLCELHNFESSPARMKTLSLLSFIDSELLQRVLRPLHSLQLWLCALKALLLLSLSFESSRDSLTSAPLQSLHAHKVLSLLSFSNTQISKEINPSSFLLQMENLDALLAILLLKQPLAESFRVFNNPVKIPQWILPQNTELKEFFSPVPICTLLNAHLAEYLLTEHPTVLSSSVHSLHLLNALLAELSESLVILVLLSELTTEFFSVHSLHWLNAHLAELHRTPQRFCLQLCSSPHSLAS
jgi:hypothetical protein